MTRPVFLAALVVSSGVAAAAEEHTLHTFQKLHLNEHFWSEGANAGDFNRDGVRDIVAGPYWYAGPDFKNRHEYYPARQTFKRKGADGVEEVVPGFEGALGSNNAYSDNFFAFAHDFNDDGWEDILILGFPGRESFWYENPRGAEGHWKRHLAIEVTDNESPTFTDITGDGRPEIVCNSGGFFGYAAPDWSNPTAPWTFHPISPKGPWQRFTHGLGVGDVNGDGRMDILDKDGWWEQPASLEGDPVWRRHEANFGTGGAQMYAYDVNGDGLNDVITSLAAHGYGLAWYEHVREGDRISFREHIFMNKEPEENRYGVQFSQLHAIDLVDMDGDGLKDILTGKRFWAHGATGDPEPGAPAVVYWFKLVRLPDGGVDFIPHLIDEDSGVGTQVVATDVNGNGLPDVVVGNKKGLFVHLHSSRQVSREEWEKAQPKPYDAAKAARESAQREGVVPVGADGKPLNLGFETGTLEDWKAEGAGFEGQPIRGDTVARRRGDMRSQHIGEYWIGTYEISGDDPQGTLTSVPFKVTHPYASFLVAGGPHANTRVELARLDEEKPFFRISGSESENLRPVVIDLKAHQDREILIRIVDQQGGHWGHINFDDFRFHAERPELPNALDSNQVARQEVPPRDVVEHAGLTPEEAVKAITLPKGFSATLFAAEPDVQQPIAMALDDRGRLWIAEAYNYPVRAPEGQGKDRILIFEDTDGDGGFDERTVFIENLNLVSGMELGFGGVWVGAAPHLMFIPDRNGDDRPDGEPVILLDGWAWQDTHETLNTFIWGPDGWLYGCHGVFTHSNVGKPGTPDSERQRINAGIWRYHPTRHEFEVFAEGTSNPWGIDFNDYGQCFIEACVIPHFYHVIQGARYQRQAGQHFNPFVYGDIKTIADHVHWAGNRGPHAGNARSDAAGGGHAHAGLMVYLGDSWPEAYRGQVFMNNIHGQRLNMDTVRREGSGYVAEHAPDFLNFNDAWSQVLNFRYDQNGSIYIIDWYDQYQCHHNDPDNHDRSNGRIFKVVYDNEPWTPVDLRRKSDGELVRLQLHRNDWHVRHARRLLQERAVDRGIDASAQRLLTGLLSGEVNPEPDSSMRPPGDAAARLRLMWAKHLTGGISEAEGRRLLGDSSEYVRGWVIQLLCERGNPSDALLEEFARMAREDGSPLVRLYLAAAMQRTPVGKRLPVLEGLLAHAEDAGDHNLPLMYWYALEPVVGARPGQAVGLLAKSKIPVVREYITRRMTAASQETASR